MIVEWVHLGRRWMRVCGGAVDGTRTTRIVCDAITSSQRKARKERERWILNGKQKESVTYLFVNQEERRTGR